MDGSLCSPPTFAKCWGRCSPSGFAYAANAPLTGFHSGSELPKQACRRLLITPSLFTSVLVTKAAYGFEVLYPFQTSAGSRAYAQIFPAIGIFTKQLFSSKKPTQFLIVLVVTESWFAKNCWSATTAPQLPSMCSDRTEYNLAAPGLLCMRVSNPLPSLWVGLSEIRVLTLF